MIRWLIGAPLVAILIAGCGGGGTPDVSSRGGIDDAGATDAAGDAAPLSTSTDAACSGDEQCAGVTPRCDRTLGRCVACAADTICAGGSVCDPTSGACVECVTDGDCDAPTPTCDVTRHLCVSTCRATSQCSGRAVCDTATGSCLVCARDTDCARGLRCDRTRGECVECLADADCPIDAPVCTPGHACSDACATDGDCQEGLGPQDAPSFCDPTHHLCIDCLRNADCGADSFCRTDGTCA